MERKVKTTFRNRKLAFTLVEVIVVLVILAVVAAMLVPALTGYIKKAKRAKYMHKADEARIAAQAVIADYFVRENMDFTNYMQQGVDVNRTTPNVQWDVGDAAVYGDEVLDLMGYGRGEENGEPYILVVGVGNPDVKTLSLAQHTTVYYVGYVEDEDSPAVFYVNGQWTYQWPKSNGMVVQRSRTGTGRNVIPTRDGDVSIQFYVICNRADPGGNDIWIMSAGGRHTLEGHSEGNNGF